MLPKNRRRAAASMLGLGSFLAVAACASPLNEPPFLLRCDLKGAPLLLLRVQPAAGAVDLLDPDTGLNTASIRSMDPLPGIPRDVVDQVSAEITDTVVRWSITSQRPAFSSDSVEINLQTMAYRGESWGGDRDHANLEVTTGRCFRLEPSAP